MTPEQIIVGILQVELGLPVNSVWIRNQNRKIANDDKLYIAVGTVDSQVVSSINDVVPTGGGMSEKQQTVVKENMQIDIFSRSTEALLRRMEVLNALVSIHSRQEQELNQMRIFSLPTSFVNTSGVEGGSSINRFSIVIGVQALFIKEKVLVSPEGDYFNKFATRVDDEETIGTPEGLIEFTIT